LSKIIDIRNDIFKVRQQVSLADEVKEVKQLLQKEITSHKVKITGNYAAGTIYAVKAMVASILYNLVSNAIKYKSSERTPEIEIKFSKDEEFYTIEVIDNGLGIDLHLYGNNIFSLYKRFHHHTEGRGLGLYLVKLQSEALGGNVHVESEINKFTKFTVKIGVPENFQEQILLNEERAKIYYDAEINSTGVIWKSAITSEEYRSIYRKGIEFLQAYNTPNWVTDLRNQGPVNIKDQEWLFTKVLPPAQGQGLRRVACIVAESIETPQVQGYIDNLKSKLSDLGIQLMFFTERDDAREWIRQQNEKAILSIKDNGQSDLT
jgi:anti-sigma regulatory factor (Ser/Thr protein kinase)